MPIIAGATGLPRSNRRRQKIAATLAAVLLSLAGCVPVDGTAPPGPGATPPAGAGAGQPVAAEKLSAPVALAPGMTGQPPAPAPSAAPAPPAGPPPAPPPAASAAIPAAAPAGEPPPAGTAPCPPGTIGAWSAPDVVGARVYICHQAYPPR
jgi:hypothetical protein